MQHDNILKMLEIYETQDYVVLVLELCIGNTLYRYIR